MGLECDLSPAAKAAFSVILIKAYPDTHTAHISIAAIMCYTSCSKSKVKRGLRELDDRDLITIIPGGGGGQSSFKVHFDNVLAQRKPINPEPPTPLEAAIAEGVHYGPPPNGSLSNGGVHNGPEGVHYGPEGVHYGPEGVHYGPLNKRKKEKKRVRPRVAAPARARKAVRPVAFKSGLKPVELQAWQHCLPKDVSGFPDTTMLGEIDGTRAFIYGCNPFQADQLTHNDPQRKLEIMERHLKQFMNNSNMQIIIVKEKF